MLIKQIGKTLDSPSNMKFCLYVSKYAFSLGVAAT